MRKNGAISYIYIAQEVSQGASLTTSVVDIARMGNVKLY